ncbi:uncharacterized protein H6S33_008898 [Morchella sextelata]|uniref:uncharacterized protein n=1 Tax=Morchella sextelata TaxID=1174677 RepID=UPI001D05801A|nr:uncharacterized protein H6S33_008898 [Morchella sextelata]KAH0612518.1 hypothetical protein H6S33_008898 [Morchella sextelata]
MSDPSGSRAPKGSEPNPFTRLLAPRFDGNNSDHGTFSSDDDTRPTTPLILGATSSEVRMGGGILLKRKTTTARMAQEAGVKRPWLMYASYYIPSIGWMREYDRSCLLGDVVAGVTMASFYIPMALSLSANLAHLPPIHGLYSFAIQPLVYALLGSCPTMAVGPEAAGSLLLGTAIRTLNQHHAPAFDDGDEAENNARLAGVITGMTGAFAFIAGIVRLGFLDSVLSRPLLRGFISAVGFVIFVDQSIPELGLTDAAKAAGVLHSSSLTKAVWILRNLGGAHTLTFAVAAVSFSIIMVGRHIKKVFEKRAPYIAFLPDRFLVVVISAILTSNLSWDTKGLQVLGNVEAPSGSLFSFKFPFQLSHLTNLQETMSTAFLISVLGFFESVVAAKSLGTTLDANISSNRELIALGTANILGGCFQALPAFGGYGRSKVNKATGGRTPVSSVVLSLCTIICTIFLLPYFYYLPRCVLCAMISVVAVSLLEEAPEDIKFFYHIRAYADLATMLLVFLTTVIWSLETGIAIGVGISLIQVIRHSTRARIQILGRVPGTLNTFKAAEEVPAEELEDVEGCLIVKLTEGLTFANTGELKNRLRRLERYGDARAHPSLPRIRGRGVGTRTVVFDVKGVRRMDGSGTQVLTEIVRGYVNRGVAVWFSRVPMEGGVWAMFVKSGIVGVVGGESHFVGSVEEALRACEGSGSDEGAV